MQHAATKPNEKIHQAPPHAATATHRASHDAKASHEISRDAAAGSEAAAPMLEGAAQSMSRSADAASDLLQDWQSLIQDSANLISDGMRSTAVDLKEFSECRTPEDYGRATVAFNQALAKRWLETGNRFATMSAEYVSRRLRLATSQSADRTGTNGKGRH
jgi:hypothetical protein